MRQDRLLLCGLIFSMAVLLSGCFSFKYLPADGQPVQAVPVPAELSAMSGSHSQVRITSSEPAFSIPAHNAAHQELAQWFQSPGEEITVHFYTVDDTSKGLAQNGRTGALSIIVSVATAMIVPFVVHDHAISTMDIRAGEQTLFRHQQRYVVRSSGSLLPWAKLLGDSGDVAGAQTAQDLLARHKLVVERHLAESRSDWVAAESSGSVDAYRDFISQHPNALMATIAMKRLAAQAPTRNPLAFHIENSRLHKAYLRFIPQDQAIWFIGPEDLRVHDVLTESRHQDASLLAARIRSAGAYKLFDGDEVKRLQSSGIKPELVAAMLDATTTVARPGQSVGQSLGSCFGDAGSTQRCLQSQGHASPAGAAMMQPAAAGTTEAQGNGVTDVMAECAQRYAALKTCDQVPFPGSTLCRAAANKKYSHLACSVIQ